MAKLYFYYSAMNAGKSTTLLQSNYNYNERGMETLVYTPVIDDRLEKGKVASRIGLQAEAISFDTSYDFFTEIRQAIADNDNIRCVLIDEAQFLTKGQVKQLAQVTFEVGVPVLCYGLRTDFQGELFEGSRYLLAWAEELTEIKTICHCGRKATMVLRVDEKGQAVREGKQVEIGGNDRYVAVCHWHHVTGEL